MASTANLEFNVKREMDEPEDGADGNDRRKRQRASGPTATGSTRLCKISGEPAEPKSVYCGRFKRAYEAIYRQVSKNRKLKDATKADVRKWEENNPQYQAWLSVFGPNGNEALEEKVLLDFVDKHPDAKQKGKARRNIDLTVYVNKSEGVRGENNKLHGRPLLDWELFSHKMASKRGWSKEKADAIFVPRKPPTYVE